MGPLQNQTNLVRSNKRCREWDITIVMFYLFAKTLLHIQKRVTRT